MEFANLPSQSCDPGFFLFLTEICISYNPWTRDYSIVIVGTCLKGRRVSRLIIHPVSHRDPKTSVKDRIKATILNNFTGPRKLQRSLRILFRIFLNGFRLMKQDGFFAFAALYLPSEHLFKDDRGLDNQFGGRRRL